jgi:hypothetical protein
MPSFNLLYITQPLPNLHVLPTLDIKLKIIGRFEHQHYRAPQTEPSHLLRRQEGLTVEEGRRSRVDSFGVGVGRFFFCFLTTFIRSKGLGKMSVGTWISAQELNNAPYRS